MQEDKKKEIILSQSLCQQMAFYMISRYMANWCQVPFQMNEMAWRKKHADADDRTHKHVMMWKEPSKGSWKGRGMKSGGTSVQENAGVRTLPWPSWQHSEWADLSVILTWNIRFIFEIQGHTDGEGRECLQQDHSCESKLLHNNFMISSPQKFRSKVGQVCFLSSFLNQFHFCPFCLESLFFNTSMQ